MQRQNPTSNTKQSHEICLETTQLRRAKNPQRYHMARPRHIPFDIVSQTVRVRVDKCNCNENASLIDCTASFVLKVSSGQGQGRDVQHAPTPGDSESEDDDKAASASRCSGLYFHCRQVHVLNATVNGNAASVEHLRFLGPRVSSVRSLQVYSAMLLQDLEAGRNGELVIIVPHGTPLSLGDCINVSINYELRNPAGIVHSWRSKSRSKMDRWCVYTRADSLSGVCGALLVSMC